MKFPFFTTLSMLGCLGMALHSAFKGDAWQALMWGTFFGGYVENIHGEFK